MKEIPVPEGLPERLKARLREENEKIRAKQKLIDEKVIYSEETIKIFNNYVRDFQTLYPGVLSDEEILNRLKANIKHDVVFEDLSYYKNPPMGVFDHKTHKVTINSKYYDSLEDKRRINAVLFHELTHALVLNNPYDPEYRGEFYEDGNFITEAIDTIMEEDYMKKILGIEVTRVNNYIPTYAHELRVVFGDRLISDYVKNFRHIDSLFDIGDKYTTCASDLIPMLDDIYYGVKRGDKDVDVFYTNKVSELAIAIILDYNLSKSDLTEKEKLDKIIELASTQLRPDFNYFQTIIKKHVKDMSLIENDESAKLLYYKNNDVSVITKGFYDKKLSSLGFKLKDFEICGLFGANEYYMDNYSYSSLPIYHQDRIRNYTKNKELYKALYNNIKDGHLDEKDLEIIALEKSTVQMDGTHLDIKHQLDYELSDQFVSLHDALCSLKEILYKCKTKEKEYIVHIDASTDIMFEKTPDEAIVDFLEAINNEKDQSTVESYKDAIIKINTLKDQGIDSVYSNGFKFAYENNGYIFVNEGSYYDDEKGNEHGRFVEHKIKLKKVAPPSLNMSSKNI